MRTSPKKRISHPHILIEMCILILSDNDACPNQNVRLNLSRVKMKLNLLLYICTHWQLDKANWKSKSRTECLELKLGWPTRVRHMGGTELNIVAVKFTTITSLELSRASDPTASSWPIERDFGSGSSWDQDLSHRKERKKKEELKLGWRPHMTSTLCVWGWCNCVTSSLASRWSLTHATSPFPPPL